MNRHLSVTVHEETLSDGSPVYNVRIVDKSDATYGMLMLHAATERDAYEFRDALLDAAEKHLVDEIKAD